MFCKHFEEIIISLYKFWEDFLYILCKSATTLIWDTTAAQSVQQKRDHEL